MSILVSPSNNTGWGLGAGRMYGGAKTRSSQHPVRVRGHYRAPWGAHTRGRTGRTTVDDVIDSVVADARKYRPPANTAGSTVDAVIDEVVANARAYARRRRRPRRRRPTAAVRAARALVRRARRVGRRAMLRAARHAVTPAGRARRQAAAAAATAIANLAAPRRGNVYWVRDAVTGTRVPVRTRPPHP